MIRTGIGLDSHKFDDKGELKLAGVKIDYPKGLIANSDGDVIYHSIFNAISQAIGGSSIGKYDDQVINKGIMDSAKYLRIALEMITKKNYVISNIGVMVEAKEPKLLEYEDKMKENIAYELGISKDAIGITFTSGEDLSAFGRAEGIQVFSVATIINVSILQNSNES